MEIRDPFAAVQGARSQSQAVAYDAGLRAYMLRIYNLMASALALTGITALVFAQMATATDAATGQLALTSFGQAIFSGPGAWIVMLAPLGLVLWLSFGVHKMSQGMAQGIFWVYSVLMGASLSSITLLYTGESIARAFFITAGTFGAMSLYGYTTKRDLTGLGSFLIMGLFGLILVSLVNLFMQSTAVSFALSVAGVLIFVGLTAYDTQKLKAMYYQIGGHAEALGKASIMGALTLYLDFINIFLHLLRFVGERR
jgi:uncharacterized protein